MGNFLVIEKKEFQKRIENLRKKMDEKGVDYFIAFSNLLDPSCVRYFCDFAAVNESAAIIVPAKGNVTVCSGQASYDYALLQNKLQDAEIKIFPEIGEVSGFEYDFEGQLDFADYFKSEQKKYRVKRIGIAGKLIFPSVIYNKLRSVFIDTEIVDFDKEIYELRAIKTAAEIECIKTASQMITETFTSVIPKINAGMTERCVQGMFEEKIYDLGAESCVQAFSPMIATGAVRSHISMCKNSLRQIQAGEILNIAAGVCYEGYNGMICSPYVLGKVPQKIKDAVLCAYDALNIAASKLQPGAGTKEILSAYTDFLMKKGYIDYCPYGSLHSTGMLECEAPVFSTENDRIIHENMTVCIDAYFKGMEWGSFRLEDTYLITKSGALRLTKYNDRAIPEIFGGKELV